jgi:hypothetical protein
VHQGSLEAEAEAWRASDIATAAVRSLRQEVTAAATRADVARAALPQKRAVTPRSRIPAHA